MPLTIAFTGASSIGFTRTLVHDILAVPELPDWLDMGTWIDGQTGSSLRVCIESRNWFETDFQNWMAEEPPAIGPDSRSEEHGSTP
jgi:hypothetical protein